MCPCLKPLDDLLKKRGHKESFRGQAWSQKCREWAYYPVVFDKASVRMLLSIPTTVVDHDHRGTHDGSESGFVCTLHDDAVMGDHPDVASSSAVRFDAS
jgi:hypothetical protein